MNKLVAIIDPNAPPGDITTDLVESMPISMLQVVSNYIREG
jgi:hypothetical protein